MAKNYLQGLEKQPTTVTVPALYIGASITEYEGLYSHQFALVPSERDPKGGVVVLKSKDKLDLRENVVYLIEAESNSDRPIKNYGITAYYLHTPRKLKVVARLEEREVSHG